MKDDVARLLGTIVWFLAFAFASGLLFVFAWPLLLLIPAIWFFVTRKQQKRS